MVYCLFFAHAHKKILQWKNIFFSKNLKKKLFKGDLDLLHPWKLYIWVSFVGARAFSVQRKSVETPAMVYGIWYMVYGIWHMVYGIWYMVYGFATNISHHFYFLHTNIRNYHVQHLCIERFLAYSSSTHQLICRLSGSWSLQFFVHCYLTWRIRWPRHKRIWGMYGSYIQLQAS